MYDEKWCKQKCPYCGAEINIADEILENGEEGFSDGEQYDIYCPSCWKDLHATAKVDISFEKLEKVDDD